jgi:hypothetical protein
MPYKIVKVKDGYSVVNTLNGRVLSKKTTLIKAKNQMKLLYMIEHRLASSQLKFI